MIALFLITASKVRGQAAEDTPAWRNGISTWNGADYQSPAISEQTPRLTLPMVDNSPRSYTLPSDPNTPDAARAMSTQHFATQPTASMILGSPPPQKPLTLPNKVAIRQTASTDTSSDVPPEQRAAWPSHLESSASTTALITSTSSEQETSIPMAVSSLPTSVLPNSVWDNFSSTDPKSLAYEDADDHAPRPLPIRSTKTNQNAETSSPKISSPQATGNEVDSDSSPADTSESHPSSPNDLKTVGWDSPASAPLQTEVTRWYQYPREWLKGWDSHAELGLDGSDGNAKTLAMQAGLELKLKTKVYTLGMDINYRQASSRNQTTEQNGRFNVHFDRLLGDTSWSAFAKHGMEWDKFKPFDLRLNLNGGFGYYWLRNKNSTFATRFGAGASREIGAPIDNWIPEAVFGMEAERQITSRQKLKGKFDYFPAWEYFGDYRLVSDVSWEILLDGSENLSLKLAATDRYDSTPQGAKPNDVYYSLLLHYKF